MALVLMEAAVDAVRSYLEANLSDFLTPGSVEDIVGWYVEEQIEVESYPIVEVLGQSSELLGADASSQTWMHSIAVICTVKNDQRDGTLRREVYRYALAIVQAMRQMQGNQNQYVVNFGSPTVDFSPAFQRRGSSTVLADALVNVRLQKRELG